MYLRVALRMEKICLKCLGHVLRKDNSEMVRVVNDKWI